MRAHIRSKRLGVDEIGHRLAGEGKQVERREDGGEVCFTVNEIVLDIVAFGLEVLTVSFSTFHLARPRSASSRTF